MHTSTTLQFLAPLLLSVLIGCGPELPADHWGAVPNRFTLAAPAPHVNGGRPFTDMAGQNGALVLAPALDMIDALTADALPVSTRAGMEWRSRPGLTSGHVWRFVLTNITDQWSNPGALGGPEKPAQSWRFVLELKPKMAPDSAFVRVLDGTRETPEGDWMAEHGTGAVNVDWAPACAAVDAATCATFPRVHGAILSVSITLDLSPELRRVSTTFRETWEGPAGLQRAVYTSAGLQAADGSGEVELSTGYDFPGQPVKAPNVVRAVWGANGSGASESAGTWTDSNGLSGTSKGATCWDRLGQIVYSYQDMQGGPHAPTEQGSRSACGDFAQVASLP